MSISTVAMLAACSGEKRETAPEKEASRDTAAMEMPADTADDVAVLPPRAADKLFDDFIYAFMKNDRFQRDRIKFPLANYVDGRNRPIAEKQWKHDYMYSRDDIYTMIFDDEAALDAEKDTAVQLPRFGEERKQRVLSLLPPLRHRLHLSARPHQQSLCFQYVRL